MRDKRHLKHKSYTVKGTNWTWDTAKTNTGCMMGNVVYNQNRQSHKLTWRPHVATQGITNIKQKLQNLWSMFLKSINWDSFSKVRSMIWYWCVPNYLTWLKIQDCLECKIKPLLMKEKWMPLFISNPCIRYRTKFFLLDNYASPYMCPLCKANCYWLHENTEVHKYPLWWDWQIDY